MDIEGVRGFVASSPHELLPPRRRGGEVPAGEVVDLLPTGPASALAVVASGDAFLVVPLAGAGTIVRRATPGDGAWAGS